MVLSVKEKKGGRKCRLKEFNSEQRPKGAEGLYHVNNWGEGIVSRNATEWVHA